MNTQDFIEKLVDDGLDDSTIIDFANQQAKRIAEIEALVFKAYEEGFADGRYDVENSGYYGNGLIKAWQRSHIKAEFEKLEQPL